MAGAILLTFFIRAVDMPAGKDTLSQLGVQLFSVAVTVVYCAALTIMLVVFVEKVFRLRLGTKGEMAGMDHELHGEHGYGLLNLN
jgi:Amt family ammonium transporter